MTTSKRYFDVWPDMRIPGRWHVKSPLVDELGHEVDLWEFREGKRLSLESRPILPLARPGHALDFSQTGFSIPVVSDRFVALFQRLGLKDEVQFIEARVQGHAEFYSILNTLRIIRCIDDARCEEVLYWLPEDERPDKIGQYRNVRGLKVDPAKVGDANIFRPWGWTGALIVSERVKLAMEGEGLTGPRFTEV
jgi:hypothetical protein